MKKSKTNPLLLWKDLLDLGVECSLTLLREKKGNALALRELKKSFLRQSNEHWQGLYQSLKRLK